MLIGVVGKMGQGKTLSMTVLGMALSMFSKKPLFANYTLNKFEYNKIEKLNDLWEANSGIVMLDELWLTMDSRLWKDNVKLSRWLNQTRKKDLIILYTTQHISQVDIRIRRATDWLIVCEKKSEGIWITFIEYQYGLIGKKILIKDQKKHYDKYNTYEVLQTLNSGTPKWQKSNYNAQYER